MTKKTKSPKNPAGPKQVTSVRLPRDWEDKLPRRKGAFIRAAIAYFLKRPKHPAVRDFFEEIDK